jgi:hypothetical protein
LELARIAHRYDVVVLTWHLLFGVAHISELFPDRCPYVGVGADTLRQTWAQSGAKLGSGGQRSLKTTMLVSDHVSHDAVAGHVATGTDLLPVKPLDPMILEKLPKRFQLIAMPSAERRLHPRRRLCLTRLSST